MKLNNSKILRWAIGIGALTSVVFAGYLTATLYATGAEAQPDKQEKQAVSANTASVPTSISTGSGARYKTTVDRKTEGELSTEDFRQASLLCSRIVMHLNKAAALLSDEQNDQARAELRKGLDLVGVIRGLLPTTVVTTVVKDAQGKEVYRHVDRVQEDRIPLHEGLIAVNVVEPITDSKQDDASVKGVRLADADLVHTSILVDLSYVESKLNRALKLLDGKPKEALPELQLAQARGVTFAVNKEDDPLVKAQLALQLAERMVEQGREEAAKANLQFARNYLELYRGLQGKGETEGVLKLQEEIAKLQGEIGSKNAAQTIRGFWGRVANWFARKPGEMHQTTAEPDKPDREKTELAERPKQ